MPLGKCEVDLDLTNVTPESLDEEGSFIPAGKYHLVITAAGVETKDGKSFLAIRYRTLAGTNRQGVGVTNTERFYLSVEAQKRLNILLKRFELLQDNHYGHRVRFDCSPLVGRDLVAEIQNEEYQTKKGKLATSSKWAFADFWPSHDPRAADTPKGVVVGASPVGHTNGHTIGRPIAPAAPHQQTIPVPAQPAGAYDNI